MQDILIKAACYVSIIILGYVLRRTGFFGPDAFGIISKMVLRITMPCAIIAGSAGRAINVSLLTITMLGFGGGVVYMCLGYLTHLKQPKNEKAFAVLNTPGYNIGTFAMPFTSNFMGPMGMVTTSLFDMGNAFICLGGAYGIAASIKEGGKLNVKRIAKTLSTSVPFLTHVTMVSLNLLHLGVPGPIVTFAKIIGDGNAFLAMLMIGVGFNLSGEKSKLGRMAKILLARYGFAAVLAYLCYFVLPFELEIRQALVILAFSPIGSAVPVFTAELKEDVGLSSATNSVSILLSIAITVILLVVML